MEVEAATHAIQYLTSQRNAQITPAVILTDSVNLLQKIKSGMGFPDWHTALQCLQMQRLLWICCPGQAGVSGNKRTGSTRRIHCATPPPPPPPPLLILQEPSTMVPKCTSGCPEHNLTCSPDSHWDALELQPFAQGYPLAFTRALTEHRSLMHHLNHLYIIVL